MTAQDHYAQAAARGILALFEELKSEPGHVLSGNLLRSRLVPDVVNNGGQVAEGVALLVAKGLGEHAKPDGIRLTQTGWDYIHQPEDTRTPIGF